MWKKKGEAKKREARSVRRKKKKKNSKTPPGLRSHQNKMAKIFWRETHPVAICMGRQEKSKSSFEKWFTNYCS